MNICEICKKEFKNKYNYSRHIQRKVKCKPVESREIESREIESREIESREIESREIESREIVYGPKNIKDTILEIFNNKIKNKEIKINKQHCGAEGHWLELQFGIRLNSNNAPDIYGYELKKESRKITLGDWSATEYLFSSKKTHIDGFNNCNVSMTRDDFIITFGHLNVYKNRYSWSGCCVPTYGTWNKYGQKLEFDDHNNLCVYYSFHHDERSRKTDFPDFIKGPKIILIAYWNEEHLERFINNKFNQRGIIICKKSADRKCYDRLVFIKPIDFTSFVNNIKNKNIIFDSGMYQSNNRNYSQFRANKNIWQEDYNNAFI